MEIRELARAVLLSPRLQDKLLSPSDGLTDDRPGPALAAPPPAPGRPRALKLEGGRQRMRFPTAGQLTDPVARGRALHFFANHELLAMELMALVLLRFPEAPSGFRRGVAHTLLEEQDHLRRYRDRMRALCVDLGDVPVSDFFWSTMADMASPLDYVVRMSMTFEQANLDHARHYADLFRAVEDHETATLMDRVYEEELGHVRHGVLWFNRWRPQPDESDWAAYNRLLPPPLSARRAKGHPYLYEARRQVGLSETFAQQLEIFSQTRGRSPTVWLFEPDFEAQHEGRPASATTRAVAEDLAPTLMFLAASDDVVVTPVRPRADVLARLTRSGFAVPELLQTEPRRAAQALTGRAVGAVEGWGETTAVADLRRAAGVEARPRSPREASSKVWAAARLAELVAEHPEWAPLLGPDVTIGVPCGDPEAVAAAAARAEAAGFAELVIKRPLSTSGQGRIRVPAGRPSAGPGGPWLARALAAGPVLVEPWLQVEADLSVLLDGDEGATANGGRAPRVSAMRFVTGRGGVYRGHVLADPTFGLPEALRKRLAFGRPAGFAGRLATLAAFVGRRLAEAGHRGPAGIDLLVYQPPAGTEPGAPRPALAVKPIVEINARRTMGHVARALRGRVAPGRFGVWLHRPLQPGDAERVDAWPAPTTRATGRRRQLERGLVATTDPARAQRVWTFVAVGRDPEDVRDLIRQHLDEPAARPLAAL